jgi:hypothetical protein
MGVPWGLDGIIREQEINNSSRYNKYNIRLK